MTTRPTLTPHSNVGGNVTRKQVQDELTASLGANDPSFRLVRFNPRRKIRKVGAAEVEITEAGQMFRLWMTEQDIKDNIVMFGRHPGLVAALEAYRSGVEIRES